MDATVGGMPAGGTRCGERSAPIVQEAPCRKAGAAAGSGTAGDAGSNPVWCPGIDVNSRRESRCGFVVWSWRWSR